MAYTQDTTRPLRLDGTPSATAVDALTNAVTSELRLLEDLIGGPQEVHAPPVRGARSATCGGWRLTL